MVGSAQPQGTKTLWTIRARWTTAIVYIYWSPGRLGSCDDVLNFSCLLTGRFAFEHCVVAHCGRLSHLHRRHRGEQVSFLFSQELPPFWCSLNPTVGIKIMWGLRSRGSVSRRPPGFESVLNLWWRLYLFISFCSLVRWYFWMSRPVEWSLLPQ